MIIFKRLLPDPSSLEISVDFALAKSISPLVAQKRSTSGAKCSSSIVGRGAQHPLGELHTGGQAAQIPALSSALLQDLSCWSISGSVSPLPKGRMFPESLWHCCETGEASQKEPLASTTNLSALSILKLPSTCATVMPSALNIPRVPVYLSSCSCLPLLKHTRSLSAWFWCLPKTPLTSLKEILIGFCVNKIETGPQSLDFEIAIKYVVHSVQKP